MEESLRLAPTPWEVRGWDVFRSSLTQDAYRKLPSEKRRQLEARLRGLLDDFALQDSVNGISAYEALQPPLYYWIMSPSLYVMKGLSLLAQVMVLRWAGVFLVSLTVLLTFAICRMIIRCDTAAATCAAVVAIMPGFVSNVARVSNEPLSIRIFTLLIWMGLRIVTGTPRARDAAFLV